MSMLHKYHNTQPQSVSDAVLWEDFRNGSKEALEIIYRRFINDLFSYGMKIKGHESLVKDCIQELFVELWNSRMRLSSTDSIKYYLLKALKFKIHHHLKKEMKDQNEGQSYTSFLLEDYVYSHETMLINDQNRSERSKVLYEEMMKLPSRQKEILHLLFYEGLSYEKVSEIMSINVRSVYTLAWKSLSVLRKRVKIIF